MLLKIKNMYDCIPVYGGKTFNPPLSGIAHHTYSSLVMDSINAHSMVTLELLLVWQGINFLHYVRFSYRYVLTTYLRPALISSGFFYDLFGYLFLLFQQSVHTFYMLDALGDTVVNHSFHSTLFVDTAA